MNKVIEIVKRNKGVIIRRGLILASAIVGLTIVGGLIASKGDEDDYQEFDNEEVTEVAVDPVDE